MSKPDKSDTVFARPRSQLVDFVFDEAVAEVFPDMIRRSVPGYESIIAMIGLLAEQYAQPHTRLYDLGCSLGAASLAMCHRVGQPGCRLLAVDNAAAMADRARQTLAQHADTLAAEVICADIRDVAVEHASVVVLNFTLQFIPPDDRLAILQNIARGMLPGGALILSEKIAFSNPQEQQRMEALHVAFKKANGYSDLEISQKRSALENVLIPDTLGQHRARLEEAGFRSIDMWFRCLNFVSLLAIK